MIKICVKITCKSINLAVDKFLKSQDRTTNTKGQKHKLISPTPLEAMKNSFFPFHI